MKILKGLLLFLVLSLVLFWGYRMVFPDHQKIIRTQLHQLASTVSFQPNDSGIKRISKTTRLSSFFTPDVRINIDTRYASGSLTGRDELTRSLQIAQRQLRELQVRFLDINLHISPDESRATAHLTALADVDGEKNAAVQELQFLLIHLEGEWLINQIDTIKTIR